MSILKKTIKTLIEETKKEDSLLLESPPLNEVSILKEKYPFKAVFIFGPAGAGKTFIKHYMKLPKDFVDVSTDERLEDIFTRFGISLKFAYEEAPSPGQEKLKQTQMRAREIAQNAARGHMSNLVLKGTPIIVDTTGENVEKLTKRINSLAYVGYDVAIIQINVPTEFSVQRDKERKRTIGKSFVKKISTEYQKDVVASEGYFDQLRAIRNVVILGDAVFPNIFCLSEKGCKTKSSDGGLVEVGYGDYLPGVTAEMIDQHVEDTSGNVVEPFANVTPQGAMKILQNIKSDMARFLGDASSGPRNPVGNKIYKGMRALVALSKGRLGQNFTDIIPSLGISEYMADEYIVAAASVLADISELDLESVLPLIKKTPEGDIAGSGGHERPHVSTVRGLTSLEEVVKFVLQENDKRSSSK
tara:strand:- start:22863 stop:24107 length:1245 start_codon:yes stop_codon:yes gene_type:complete